jgi:cysteine-rich repeat protein
MDGEESHPRPLAKDGSRLAEGTFPSGAGVLQRALHFARSRLGGRAVASALLALAVAAALTGWMLPREAGPAAALRRWVGLESACGNHQLDAGEECDDGNDRGDDACLPSCLMARCGDGVQRKDVEECDDGNRLEGDGCTSACLACPRGPNRFSSAANGHCYWREDQPLSFAEAAARCVSGDGHLVTFDDDREWREVTEQLLGGGNAPAVWIGLKNEDRNGVRDFGWIDGGRVLSVHWSIQEPRRTPGGLDCGAQGAGGNWGVSSCEQERAYVCERPAWVIEPRTGAAYRRFVEEVTWERARAACAGRGAHLVTFSDLNEQAFVAGHFQGAVWIGAHLVDERGKFGWLTGETAGYVDFAPGEPNFLADQKCVALDVDRRWYNRVCDARHDFVCEK